MEFLLVSLVLMLAAGSVCGLVAVAQISKLKTRIQQLERSASSRPGEDAAFAPTPPATRPELQRPTWREDITPPDHPTPAEGGKEGGKKGDTKRGGFLPAGLVASLQQNWMVWLGGFCVALAGIFLARYSIEAGLLGPKARVSGGIATGLMLHAAAEYFRRRTGAANPAFAALAGGGSITLFAVLLASLHFYGMFSVPITFALLALVGLATMWLARLHGPALAAIGLLGAFVVPLVVSSGNDRATVALAYALVVSASALLLMRYVFRPWLWWGFMAGALGWWLLLLFHPDVNGLRGLYLAALAYMLLAIPHFDWKLAHRVTLTGERYSPRVLLAVTQPDAEKVIAPSLLLLSLALGIAIVAEQNYSSRLLFWLPLLLVLLRAVQFRENLLLLPTVALVMQLLAWLAGQVVAENDRFDFNTLTDAEARTFLPYLGVLAISTSLLALHHLATCRFKAIWSSLAVLAPLLCLTTGYLLASHLTVSWTWATIAFLVAMAYLAVATAAFKRQSAESLVVWLFFGGHFALSLAGAMVFDEATLTLVLAAQAISTAWIIQRFRLPGLGWLLKLLVVIVIIRLTLNPWLASYPADVHWSFWTYGGAALCCGIAAYLVRGYPLTARWAEGATLHLFVLFVWAEVRYWIHDGEVFLRRVTFEEVAIYATLFGALSVVYYRRSIVSHSLERLYRLFSALLGLGALAAYSTLVLSVLASAKWAWDAIGPTPVFNLTLLAFAAPVVLGIISYAYNNPRQKKFTALFTGFSAFTYISFQIRHLWQATLRFDLPTSNGELYTYSAVWLLMSVAAILGGTLRYGKRCYQAGMLLLALVIGKLFVIDMAGLEGLLRVASFMGLGLSLLAISYLHTRLADRRREST
ncbi:MAG: DUF2339 domain-containing protein [Pseudomonadota bacterium]